MKRCVLALLALALCNLLFHGTAQAAPKQAASDAVRVAVLPFQINGGADLNYLNDELPKLFEQRLAQKGFKVIPAKDTLRLLKNQQISQLNLATARSIARQAGANYAVYGASARPATRSASTPAWWMPLDSRGRSPISSRSRT